MSAIPDLAILRAGEHLVCQALGMALAGRCRIYAPDTIGDVGRSELDDFAVYPKKGGDFSAWLGDLCAELGIARADLIGGSMGGWIPMHHAISSPDSVRKLVLLGPMGLPSWRTTFKLSGR